MSTNIRFKQLWSLIIIVGLNIISLLLFFFVFYKSRPNFPIIVRTNDLGINYLINRYYIWQIPFSGILIIIINSILSYVFQKTQKYLSKLLFFANIGITILLLLISVQLYFLNR